jgi:hypothetical protein
LVTGPNFSQVVYSNEQFIETEGMTRLEPLQMGGQHQLLVVWNDYGTGNIHGWKVVDLRAGRIREWTQPDAGPEIRRQLHLGEEIGKEEGAGPRVERDRLVERILISRRGDPNCCPSGGVVEIRMNGRDGALSTASVSRVSQ